jgi:hypothetical protein
MDQRRNRRVIAAAALTLALALAPPAHAAGMRIEPGLFGKGWQWLTATWPWTGGAQQAPAARQDSRIESKRSAGIDPNGAQIALTPSPAPSERSVGVDPQK